MNTTQRNYEKRIDMTLEELAEKHEEHEFSSGLATYTFTLPQLRELIKEAVGSPVAMWNEKEDFARDAFLWKEDDRHPEYSTPLHALSVSLEDV
jgi:hypothetical protein